MHAPPNSREDVQRLARRLSPHLEAVANLHYLLDYHIRDPKRLLELRMMEDESFEAMLKIVQDALE
jgi:hypothetical protein